MDFTQHISARDLGDEVNPGGTRLFAVMTVFVILAWIAGLARLYVRLCIIKHLAPDDYLMFTAVVIYAAYYGIAMHGVIHGGTGQRKDQQTPETASTALLAWYLAEMIYPPLSALVRTSIAVFLLRIATVRAHKITVYVVLAVIWLLSVVYFFIMVFQCTPPDHFYKQVLGHEGSCIDPKVVPISTITHSVVCAVCDFTLAVLPVAMLWKVKLNKRTKLTIAALLGMGFVAGIALIVRIPYVKFLAVSSDFLYETIDVGIWSVMEPSLGIIAGCTATLRPLFKTWGFGPGSSRRYASKPKSDGASAGGWHGILKLQDDSLTTPASDTQAVAFRNQEHEHGSDIELIHEPRSGAHGNTTVITSRDPWDRDVERDEDGQHAI